MQGSLDAPPIIVRTSRLGNVIGFIVCAAMAYFRIYIFWLGVIYFGWQLLDSSRLIIAPDGFSVRTSFSRKHWTWNQVSNFRKASWGQLAFDIDGKSEDSFGFGWDVSTGRLAELINSARARWLGNVGFL